MYLAGRPKNMPHTATQRQYEDYFRENYKGVLDFYRPKKDQCGICVSYKNRPQREREDVAIKAEQEKHLSNKKLAREIKDNDISIGTEQKEVCVATFDLQKVFFCPFGDNGEFIFRRKLRCYNLSIFQSVVKRGYCYVWDET